MLSPTFRSLFRLSRDFLLPLPPLVPLPAVAAAVVAASSRLRLTCTRRRFFSLSGESLTAEPSALTVASGESDRRRFFALPLATIAAATAGFLSFV